MCNRPEAGFLQKAFDKLPNPEDYYVIGACTNSSEIDNFLIFRNLMNFRFSISDQTSLGKSFEDYGVNFVAINKDKIYTSYQSISADADQLMEFLRNAATGVNPNLPQTSDIKISNYPNPFNGTTNINFSTQKKDKCELKIFDFKGQMIQSLLNESVLEPGKHSFKFNGENLTSGIYLARVKIGSEIQYHKVNFIK